MPAHTSSKLVQHPDRTAQLERRADEIFDGLRNEAGKPCDRAVCRGQRHRGLRGPGFESLPFPVYGERAGCSSERPIINGYISLAAAAAALHGRQYSALPVDSHILGRERLAERSPGDQPSVAHLDVFVVVLDVKT